ncbi:synaptotagmin-like protein 4 [Penaeus vannamei]|uniref:synaptotagmin-like protein 4 n=1 Tax=Penaeus vannamei TaxID=6689 RepID=UPI00387F40D6
MPPPPCRYVKVYLLPDKSKSGKRKTKVKKPAEPFSLENSRRMSELDRAGCRWAQDVGETFWGSILGKVLNVPQGSRPERGRWKPGATPGGDLILALKFVPPDAVTGRKARRSRGALHVLVKEAKSLAAIRPHGTADPICKGLLLPEKGKASKQKTSVCRKTLNPTWNHTLVFEDTSLQELTERSLELSVWDHDRLGTSQFLGGCRLNLGKGEKAGGQPWGGMEARGERKNREQMLERPNLWVEGSIMLRPSMDKPIYSSSMTE